MLIRLSSHVQDNRCWSIFKWRSLEALKSSVFVLCRIKCARVRFNLGANHIIMQRCLLQTAPANVNRRVYRHNLQRVHSHTVSSHLACAHVFFFPPLRAGGWLPRGSPTPGHLSLNNLHRLSCQPLNNSKTLLIFCKIMAVILRWKRLRVGVWGSWLVWSIKRPPLMKWRAIFHVWHHPSGICANFRLQLREEARISNKQNATKHIAHTENRRFPHFISPRVCLLYLFMTSHDQMHVVFPHSAAIQERLMGFFPMHAYNMYACGLTCLWPSSAHVRWASEARSALYSLKIFNTPNISCSSRRCRLRWRSHCFSSIPSLYGVWLYKSGSQAWVLAERSEWTC